MRLIADIIGIWGPLGTLGLAASLTVRPHAVAEEGLLVRYGTGTHFTVPWDAISKVTSRERSHDKSKTVQPDSDGSDPVLMVVVGEPDQRGHHPQAVRSRSPSEAPTRRSP